MAKSKITRGYPGRPGAKEERKLFTWYDVNRILRQMRSPEIPTALPAALMREYFACASSYFRIVNHFDGIRKTIPSQYYRHAKASDLDLYFVGMAQTGIAVSQFTVEVWHTIQELGVY